MIKIIPTLHPVTIPKDPLKKTDEKQMVTARTIKSYTVDVRPLRFLAQPDFISHQPFAEKGGMLILIDPTQVTSLQSSNLLGNVDVLFVSPDGLILKIVPDITLPALEEPISSEAPVHAFVFLKGQTARMDDIEPGDRIENPLFRQHPVILDGSSLPAVPAPSVTQAVSPPLPASPVIINGSSPPATPAAPATAAATAATETPAAPEASAPQQPK